MMDNKEVFGTVAQPREPEDFLAIIPQIKESPHSLSTKTLAILYGMSHLEGYSNKEVIGDIDSITEDEPNPVDARFHLAVELLTSFWDRYSTWGRSYTPEETQTLQKIMSGEDSGEVPMGKKIAKGEPGYTGPIPEELKEKTTKWLIEGIKESVTPTKLYSVQQIGERVLAHDALLDKKEYIKVAESVDSESGNLRNDADSMRLIERIKEIRSKL